MSCFGHIHLVILNRSNDYSSLFLNIFLTAQNWCISRVKWTFFACKKTAEIRWFIAVKIMMASMLKDFRLFGFHFICVLSLCLFVKCDNLCKSNEDCSKEDVNQICGRKGWLYCQDFASLTWGIPYIDGSRAVVV